jgi:hypothetical protein
MSKELHDLLTEMVKLYQERQCFLSVHAERLCAMVDAAPAAPAPAWQSIEMAPKDEEVLLFGQINKRAFIGAWGDYMRINQPRITHWMPLPAPPAITASKGDADA